MATTKGKKKVTCSHTSCAKSSFLSKEEQSCLDDVGMTWMCEKHDDERTMKCNAHGGKV